MNAIGTGMSLHDAHLAVLSGLRSIHQAQHGIHKKRCQSITAETVAKSYSTCLEH